MSYILTFFEITEIKELLVFKRNSLAKSKMFLKTVHNNRRTGSLEADIKLSIQEITDLEDFLIHSAV